MELIALTPLAALPTPIREAYGRAADPLEVFEGDYIRDVTGEVLVTIDEMG